MSGAPGRAPTTEQRDAIALRKRDVFLRAGAGTGKTGVLVDRYCAAICDDEVSPERILAFTFTERAAAELRRRARRELERRAAVAADPEAGDTVLSARLQEAVRQLGGAPITTIHGFCRRLLASHPVAAGIDPHFRVLDAGEARRIAWAAFGSALEDLVAEGNDSHESVLAVYGVQRARNLVLAAHAELRSRGDQPRLPPVAPRDLSEALARLEAAATAVEGASGGSDDENACFAQARSFAAGRGERLPELAELEALERDGKSTVPERRACSEAIRATVAVAAEGSLGMRAYEALDTLFGHFAERFEEAKAQRSGLDFEDLQIRAVALLRDNAGIGASVRERFAHVLVDEFQDTNALQLALIEQLQGPEGRLFVVGDRFQAIYGFRHADIGVFTGQERRFAERPDARVLSLTGNFRSRPEIVATANALGTALMDPFDPLSSGRRCDPLSPGDPAVELLITEPGDWSDEGICLERRTGDPMPAECVAEARHVALRLRLLADVGARPGDMVVLLRAFTHVDAFEEALSRVGLSPFVAGGGGYWSQQQTQDLISLLSAIANPLADQELLGVLASPACGVSPSTLWLLRRAVGRDRSIWSAVRCAMGSGPEPSDSAALEAISADDRGRLEQIHELLIELRALGTRLPLDSLLERAISGSGYDLGVLLADHGTQRFANVGKLLRLARDYEAVEGRNLRGFLDYAAQSAEQDTEPPAAVEAEEGEGVRIMTTHAAKGLEFPIVAVAELGREVVRKGGAGDIALGRATEDPLRAGLRLARIGRKPLELYDYSELVAEGMDRDEAEELRLAYVAVTRARDRLLLSGIRKTTDHRDRRALSVLRRFLSHNEADAAQDGDALTIPGAGTVGAGASGSQVEIPIRVSAASAEEGERLSMRFAPVASAPEPLPGPPPIVSAPEPPAPVRPLSYSTLQEHARCGYRFYVERVIGLAEPLTDGRVTSGESVQRARGMRVGNAVHELLRQSAEARWSAPGDAMVAAALAREGLDPADTDVSSRVRSLVSGWLESSLCAELRSDRSRVRPEHPFLVDLAGTAVRGAMDLLVERPGREPLVIDYKTDRINGSSPVELVSRYEVQRGLYAVAAAEGLGAPAVEVAYVFLERAGEPVRTLLAQPDLDVARESLSRQISEISDSHFEVTPNPDWPLCRDCPARARLCPAPASAKAA